MDAVRAAAPVGMPPDSIGATLTRDGARLASALGFGFAEGYREVLGLLAHVTGLSRAEVTARHRDALPADTRVAYAALVERRCCGEPHAYLVGSREFYGMDFVVTPAVLIPRPETELLVEAALERLPADRELRVLDLGTGSGVLAITLARLRPMAQVTAVELSADALTVARVNAIRRGVEHVRLLQSDWFAGVAGERFDLIVCNPPYVATGDPHRQSGDLRFEPGIALDGGADGLDCLRAIVSAAPAHLFDGGWLLVEHGYDQAASCRNQLATSAFEGVFTARDLAGIERVSGGQKPLR